MAGPRDRREAAIVLQVRLVPRFQLSDWRRVTRWRRPNDVVRLKMIEEETERGPHRHDECIFSVFDASERRR